MNNVGICLGGWRGGSGVMMMLGSLGWWIQIFPVIVTVSLIMFILGVMTHKQIFCSCESNCRTRKPWSVSE